MSKRYRSKGRIGSRVNAGISLSIFILLNHFFGFSIFNEVVFVIISGVSYRLTGAILRWLSIWNQPRLGR